MNRKQTFEIPTDHGVAICEVIKTSQHQQANIYLAPNGGASLFALFPIDEEVSDIEKSLKPVLNGPSLISDLDITDEVEGCIVAGTVKRPTVDIQVA